ncbi:BglII/BstYI family type II restriction endonuclease [Enterococcus sp.]|uniref:BglII/BstYI family type II restriction endonuclease n=1 Tax=Enterococcus sp. TaxID=35783 RepID=UPI000ED27EBA|nr:BglII/BstYI family type II restriction endonuclease [Enterococcus sp.]HCM86844.1 restriction endonuclease [Enterococcus sp.]
MKIAEYHSHLNGYEFLQVHKPDILEEIESVIKNIDAESFRTKQSKEKNRVGTMLYSPRDINTAFREEFKKAHWDEHRNSYYLTSDAELAYKTMALDAPEQKKIIESEGKKAFLSYNQTDFLKERIAIEVQFGKYAFVAYDLFVKHMAFFIANDIDVGIEIIPTKKMCADMSSGIAYYEGEVYNVYRQGRNTPAVPLLIIGIEP